MYFWLFWWSWDWLVGVIQAYVPTFYCRNLTIIRSCEDVCKFLLVDFVGFDLFIPLAEYQFLQRQFHRFWRHGFPSSLLMERKVRDQSYSRCFLFHQQNPVATKVLSVYVILNWILWVVCSMILASFWYTTKILVFLPMLLGVQGSTWSPPTDVITASSLAKCEL